MNILFYTVKYYIVLTINGTISDKQLLYHDSYEKINLYKVYCKSNGNQCNVFIVGFSVVVIIGT